MKKFTTIIALLLGVFALATPAVATDGAGPLTVDGVQYEPSKVSGPATHYETPDTNPTSAFNNDHTWEGNGSDNLPCPGGIHWISNKNVLTVSHCLDTTTTTTTTSPATTTTALATTTTTVAPTTTEAPGTSSTTTSPAFVPSTTVQTDESTVPSTAPPTTQPTATTQPPPAVPSSSVAVDLPPTTQGHTEPTLPETGSAALLISTIAACLVLLGWILVRRAQ